MLAGIFVVLAMQPDPAMLRRLFEEALARDERQYGINDARTAQAARDLGLFLVREGDTRAGRETLAKTVHIDEAVFGAPAEQTLMDAAELAAVSPPEQAEPLWLRVTEAVEPELAARALDALGGLHRSAGDQAGAADFYRRAVAKQESAAGRDSEPVAMELNALAKAVPPKAGIPLLERALAIDRRVLGPRHPEAASTETNLAGLLVKTGQYDEAIRAADEALGILQATLGAGHPRCAIAANIMADGLAGKGEFAKAEKAYRLALSIDQQAYGPHASRTEEDRQALALCMQAMGKK